MLSCYFIDMTASIWLGEYEYMYKLNLYKKSFWNVYAVIIH